MKVIMIYDQIQSGAGIKDDHMIPLGAKKEPVGPAIMMEQYLKTVDGRVMACIMKQILKKLVVNYAR